MTFESEGSPIDKDACNKEVLEQVHKVLDGYQEPDPAWIDEPVTTNPAGKKSVGTIQSELIK
jgi:hypothetical protein